MDELLSKFFEKETGCTLVVERQGGSLYLQALGSDGNCIGTRFLTTAQASNPALVRMVIDDFAIQTNHRPQPPEAS